MTTSASLSRYKARIVARFPHELNEIVAALPGARFDRTAGAWTYPATAYTAASLRAALRPRVGVLDVDPAVDALLERADRAKDARALRTRTDLPDVPSGSEHEAWQHQRQAFYWAREQDAILLDMAMGTGKSKIVVDLFNDWQVHRGLIICPKNVVGVWPREFRKHSRNTYRITDGRPFKRGTHELKAKPKIGERTDVIADALADDISDVIVVLHYDVIWREPLADLLLEQQWDVGFIDECHRAQAAGGKGSRFLDRLRDRCERRGGGTGTLGQTPLAAYGYCRFIEPALFGTRVADFRVRYGKPRIKYMAQDVDSAGELVSTPVPLTTPNGDIIYDGVRDDVYEEFTDRLSRITYSCDDSVLDLPDNLHSDRPVEQVPLARRVYRELETELAAEVRDGLVTIDNAPSKLLRLQQVTSGFVVTEHACPHGCSEMLERNVDCTTCKGNGFVKQFERIDNSKQEALIDDLRNIPVDKPVVIFCRFRPDLDALAEAADKSGRVYAELSGRRRDALNDDAELAEHVQLAGVQIQAGGVGIDFTRARYGGYLSYGTSIIDYQQSQARLRRPGMDVRHPVEWLHYTVEDSIDNDVRDGLANRKEAIDILRERLRGKA